ncbi:ABC transporter permease [Arthrobacter sp. UYCu712]|uniref:ABC transporter permease n=1 Tax=Arthrobacter sp. UYCu712 TaxID=3156340 RepID=UPI00339700DD
MSIVPAAVPHTKWSRVVLIAIAAASIVGVVLLAFTWAGITSSAKNIPLAVTGPDAQVQTLEKALEDKAGGTFAITTVDSRDAATALIRSRDAYAAVVLGQAPEVLTASANGTAVSQILTGVAQQLQAQINQAAAAATEPATAAGQPAPVAPKVTVTDVVPLAASDAKGTGLALAAFPLAFGGMIGGILVSLLVVGSWRRLGALALYSILAGGIFVLVMQGLYGVLQGDVVLNGLGAALALLGTGSFIVGLNALIGTAGIPVGAVTTMLIANPISAATAPMQFLPEPWGAIGQWFVPGASTTLLRDLSYFPDANALFPWLILAGWTVIGIMFTMIGHFRNQEVIHVEGSLDAEPVPATATTRS